MTRDAVWTCLPRAHALIIAYADCLACSDDEAEREQLVRFSQEIARQVQAIRRLGNLDHRALPLQARVWSQEEEVL